MTNLKLCLQMDSQLTFARDNFHFLFDLWLRLLKDSRQAEIGWDAQQIQQFLSVIRRLEAELNTCVSILSESLYS